MKEQSAQLTKTSMSFENSFPIFKQKFVKIKEAEYSTNFEEFVSNNIQVVINKNNVCQIVSGIEKRIFWQGPELSSKAIYQMLATIHKDIISLRYDGELVF